MENATTIALSRLVAQTRAMDVTANNLANIGTPGFRGERMLFSDWLVKQPIAEPGPGGFASSPSGSRNLTYTQDRATYRTREAGAMAHTANALDLAIAGDGFFTVLAQGGPRLTRSGHFERGPDGTIMDASGFPLLDTTGKKLMLAAADTVITVAANGTISSQNGQIGQIGLVNPDDPNRMRAEGGRLLASDSPTKAVASPQITQGALEESNVQPTLEITRMMSDLREFQFTSQFVQAEADRQQSAIDKITQRRG
jgi:flagellar basal-body rod protein FlgF